MPLEPTLSLLLQYGIIAACNIPLTKVFIFLIRKVAGIFIPIDSGYYTVAAFLPTILPILLHEFYKIYPDHQSWQEKIAKKGIKGVIKDLAPACVVLFVSCFMMFVFEPILIYATNINDFWFDIRILIWPVLSMFAVFFLEGFVFIILIYNVDLLISKRLFLYRGIILAGSIIFLLLYLQGNWLDGNLPVLDGEQIVWENYGRRETSVLIIVTAILAIIVIISIIKRGLNRTVFYASTGAAVLFVMLFASLVPTVVVNKAFISKDTSFSASMKNYDTISSNKNFLIFVVDSVNSDTCIDVMMEDDDFRGMMKDFSYYPDTLSVYPRTLASIPNILTGTEYLGDMEFREYTSNAYNQSPFFEKLAENGYEINLYGLTIWWDGVRNFNIENAVSIHDNSVDLSEFMKQELKYIMFKYLPYELKKLSKIETLDFNACKRTKIAAYSFSEGNLDNYKHITEINLLDKQRQNYFQLIHCNGAHPPFNLDKDLNYVEKGTEVQSVEASLTLVKAYLQRLKDNDAYDNSVIVIMADHGNNTDYAWAHEPVVAFSRCNPILFIKGINEKHEMLESDRPVSYADLQDAFSDLIDGKQSTELFLDLEQGRRRFWYTDYDLGKGRFVGYMTTGKAWEWEKCIPTGVVYDYIDQTWKIN